MIKLLVLTFLISGCTSIKKMKDNQRKSGHLKLYTYPASLKLKEDDRYKRVNIFSLNDFNNKTEPTKVDIPNRFGDKRVLEYGGFDNLTLYLKTIKKQFPHALFINSGNAFTPQETTQQIFKFNILDFDISILGDKEWKEFSTTNSLSEIERTFKRLKHPILQSNLFDLKRARNYRWKNIKNYSIKKSNGIKVGFLSIMPQSFSHIISKETMNGIFIQKPLLRIIETSRILRRKGAQIIVLVTPESVDCTYSLSHDLAIPIEKINFRPRNSNHCISSNHEILSALKVAPKGTVDLVLTSGDKTKVSNFINDIPVIQNYGEGNYLSWATLTYDTKFNKVVPEQTQLHQPIQLCRHFLKENLDCYTKEKLKDKELMPAILWGKSLTTN